MSGAFCGRFSTSLYQGASETGARRCYITGNAFTSVDNSSVSRTDALVSSSSGLKMHPSPGCKPDAYGCMEMSFLTSGPTARQMHMTLMAGDGLMDQIPMSSHMFGFAPPEAHELRTYGGVPSQLIQQGVFHNELAESEAVTGDPHDMQEFAERFKQRRIKLGVTQADVGRALGNLKIPGIGSLSQSTICRFESLTLSHNNMAALKPVLLTWLDEAERIAHENKVHCRDVLAQANDRKRKRTSIASPEKRSLETYFAIQPRPSGEKISQIADKLDLKKNVVRVWFCNQRQKQKRMKFAAVNVENL